MDKDDLHRLLLARNARFRAWAAHGVPVEAAWHWTPEEALALLVVCRVHGYRWRDQWDVLRIRGRVRVSLFVHEEERAFNSFEMMSCTHLRPMMTASVTRRDPDEVRALYELELIAGG